MTAVDMLVPAVATSATLLYLVLMHNHEQRWARPQPSEPH